MDSRRESDDLSATTLRQGEEAYKLHEDEWKRQYAGQYIVIYQGEVVASDADKTKLTEEIIKKQRQAHPFHVYVMQVEDPRLIEEEIHDFSSYLNGTPYALRSSGAFAAYESRLTRLQQRLSRLQNSGDAEGTGTAPDTDKRS